MARFSQSRLALDRVLAARDSRRPAELRVGLLPEKKGPSSASPPGVSDLV